MTVVMAVIYDSIRWQCLVTIICDSTIEQHEATVGSDSGR